MTHVCSTQSSYAQLSKPQIFSGNQLAHSAPDFESPLVDRGVVASRTLQGGTSYGALANLGLNELNLEASFHDLLSDPSGKEAAMSLTEDAARSFLNTLQNALSVL